MFPRDDGLCDGKWVPVRSKEDYTRPIDGAQIVSELYTGPGDVQISKTSIQSWSTTIETSLGFADVISLGLSFSSEFSESLVEFRVRHVPRRRPGHRIRDLDIVLSVS